MAEPELWNTDSLCFTYYNILQQYKTTKQTYIEWLRVCRNSPASEAQIVSLERRIKIEVADYR